MCCTEPQSSTLPWSSTVSRSQMSRMKSRSCSTITREQRFLIGCSSSPVTRLSSRLMPPVGSSGSRLVIWNLRLMPARARVAGGACEISWPPKITVPDVGISAPATHFISVLLPEPLGPIKPWNSFSATVRSAPFRAVSLPKILIRPRASRRAMIALPRRPAEIADALALAEDQADEAGGAKQDDQQQQDAEDDRPDVLIAVRQPETHRLDRNRTDDSADQRAGTAEQYIEHHLRRHHHAQHVGPDEPFMKGIKAAREPRDGAGEGKDDRFEALHLIAEEGYPLLVLAQTRQRKPELRPHQEAAQEINQHENAERQIIIDRPLRNIVAAERHRRDRWNAVLAAEIIPAP